MVLSEKGKGELRKFLNFSITTMLSQTLRFFKKFKYRALTQLIEGNFWRNLLEFHTLWSMYWIKNTSLWDLSLLMWLHFITTYFPFLCEIVLFPWLWSLICLILYVHLFLVFMHLYDWGHYFISPLTQIAYLLLSIVCQFWAYA